MWGYGAAAPPDSKSAPQEKISENSGYFGIRDSLERSKSRHIFGATLKRCLNVPEYPMIFFNNFSISKSVSEFLN